MCRVDDSRKLVMRAYRKGYEGIAKAAVALRIIEGLRPVTRGIFGSLVPGFR